ncbi:UNVERIFIED_CONTAM: protein CutA, chloroplastic [Sesamum calycinum]|uniref:Protein CutA, chloroplastic n=1 Tax=Sesamum calycinum TaxID=2727403 RepID=A0AAW2NSX7_9LAMI
MALRLSSVVSSTVVRRRIPLVGAFCVLSLGLSNLCSISLTSRTGFVQSLPFVPLLSSKFGAHAQTLNRKVHNISMERARILCPASLSMLQFLTKKQRKSGYEVIMQLLLGVADWSYLQGLGLWLLILVLFDLDTVCTVVMLTLACKIQTDSEELLIIKTRESLLEPLTEHVKANHEYERISPLHHHFGFDLSHHTGRHGKIAFLVPSDRNKGKGGARAWPRRGLGSLRFEAIIGPSERRDSGDKGAGARGGANRGRDRGAAALVERRLCASRCTAAERRGAAERGSKVGSGGG